MTAREPRVPVYGVGQTARLRGWRPADLAAYREWLRPHHEWHDWDGPYYPVPDDAQADARVAALASAPAGVVDGLPPRTAVIADADDHLVGTVSWYWESQETAWARMGIGVYDPAVRGGDRPRGARSVDHVPLLRHRLGAAGRRDVVGQRGHAGRRAEPRLRRGGTLPGRPDRARSAVRRGRHGCPARRVGLARGGRLPPG
ncbi:hypothetical protein NKG05_02380 [Oerskovia sp. M15]